MYTGPYWNITISKVQENKISIVSKVLWCEFWPLSIKVSNIGIIMDRERLWTHKRPSLTETVKRTDKRTEKFIITVWTLWPSITDLVSVETDLWRPTFVVSRTSHVTTLKLILSWRTIFVTVTSEWENKKHCWIVTASTDGQSLWPLHLNEKTRNIVG